MLASWFVPTMSDAARTAYFIDWTDELEGFTPGMIRKAFAAHRDAEPGVRPNAGHIKAILRDRWGRHVVAKARETEALAAIPAPGQHRETAEERRISADRARAIMAEVMATLKAANGEDAA